MLGPKDIFIIDVMAGSGVNNLLKVLGRFIKSTQIIDIYCVELDAILKNIGIRLVSKSCREMEYHSLLGLNVMSITM